MNTEVLEFLRNNRVSVATTLLKNGLPHSAALHYSHKDDPLTLYFSTESTSRKCEGMLDGISVKASVVVGFDEKEWLTLQLEGEMRIVPKDELVTAQEIHYKKHPSSEKWKNDPTTVILEFTPKWWRFTDLNVYPYRISSSEE